MSIDAHCHIDLHPDPNGVLEKILAANLQAVAVTTTPAAFEISSRFTNSTCGVVPALGIHPEVVCTRPNDIELFAKYLGQVKWVGEVGLDGSSRFRSMWQQQVRVFERVLKECADVGGRLLSIHSRAATEKVLELLSQYPESGVPVFHWFSGSTAQLERAVELGGYFSVNIEMSHSRSGMAIVRKIPRCRLLTESDAPFVQYDSKSPPEQIHSTELRLAEILDCSVDELTIQMHRNFEALNQSQNQ